MVLLNLVALSHNRIKLHPEEVKILFEFFDRSKEGMSRYRDFVTALRGFMSEYRRSIAEKLYDRLLYSSSKRVLSFEDIKKAHSLSQLGNTELDVTEQTAQDFLDLLLYHQLLWVGWPYSERGEQDCWRGHCTRGVP